MFSFWEKLPKIWNLPCKSSTTKEETSLKIIPPSHLHCLMLSMLFCVVLGRKSAIDYVNYALYYYSLHEDLIFVWRIFQFAGFSSDSFAERILDCEARVVVTADGVWRGEKLLQLKSICDHAMDKCSKEGHNVETCIVVSHLERVSSPKGGSQTRQTNKVIERFFFG